MLKNQTRISGPVIIIGHLDVAVPDSIANEGSGAVERFLEFFAANIRNRNTRTAYARAIRDFFQWTEWLQLNLRTITPLHVAAYVEQFAGSAPTIKQHLSAIRTMFNWLVTGGILASNPASPVRGPKHVVKIGKTPVLQPEEVNTLFNSIRTDSIVGLRDRALIAVMVYSFARVGAVVGMVREDYYQQGARYWLRLHEKGGKFHQVPAHCKVKEYLSEYLVAIKDTDKKRLPIFRSVNSKRELTERALDRREVWEMIKRRARAAGLPPEISCHSFRATGITSFLRNGGTIEKAQEIAAHESSNTTRLYDRTAHAITLEEIEKIQF